MSESYRREIDLPQTIFPQADFVWQAKIRSIPENHTGFKIICGLHYYDNVLKTTLSDFLVRNWLRGPDGKPGAIVTIPTSEVYQKLHARFSNEMKKYIGGQNQSVLSDTM
jgi:hypothetical protein